jgi:hypothetical protein
LKKGVLRIYNIDITQILSWQSVEFYGESENGLDLNNNNTENLDFISLNLHLKLKDGCANLIK